MADWGETLANAFSRSYSSAQDKTAQMAFEKWKIEQQQSPKNIANTMMAYIPFIDAASRPEFIRMLGEMSKYNNMDEFVRGQGAPAPTAPIPVPPPNAVNAPNAIDSVSPFMYGGNAGMNIGQGVPMYGQPSLGIKNVRIGGKLGGVTLGQPAENPLVKANIEVAKEVASQSAKAGELGARDYLRVNAIADTNLRYFYDFANKQLENTGFRAGDLFGIIDKLTPRQLNEFKDAFASSSKEASATVAKALIPNMRAIQGAVMFKGSTANVGSTLAGSINNVAETMSNAFAGALAQNIADVDEAGNPSKIQDLAIDPASNKPLSALPTKERSAAINRLKEKFRQDFKLLQYSEAFKTNPKLLTPRELKDWKDSFPSDYKFKNEADAEKANLPRGTMVIIGNELRMKE